MEAEIRPQVAGRPCVNFPERERFTKHMLSKEQKANFWLLVAGFCRRFVSDSFKLPDKQNRKAAFSAAGMKLLSNFRSGKSSQENILVIIVIIVYDNSV